MKNRKLIMGIAIIISALYCSKKTDILDISQGKGGNDSLKTTTVSAFVHPGVFNSNEELNFIKQKVNAGEQPWKSGYDKMLTYGGSSLSVTTTAYPIIWTSQEPGQPAGASITKFGDAAHAAYNHALQWIVTGNQNNANKAMQLMDAWSGTLQEIRVASRDYAGQAALNGSQYGSIMIAAAEIVRYSNAGWSSAKVTQFQNMLANVFYPLLSFWPTCNGYSTPGCSYTDNPEFSSLTKRASNQEASYSMCKMAIGVFNNDQAKFDSGKDGWIWLLKRYVYPSGQLGETCRDCTHSVMGLIDLMKGAEIAWNQGVDLYSTENSRLATGMEWSAKTLLGISQASTCGTKTCASGSDAKNVMGWEIGYNHYHNRAGKTMASTEAAVLQLMRPETHRWNFLSWNTLTHADMPKSFNKALNKPVTFSGQQTGYEASSAVDGDLSTSWSSINYPQWIQVDLGAAYSINKTQLAPGNGRAYKYKIDVKTSFNGAYTTIINNTNNTTEGAIHTDTFTPVNARYVKITIISCTGPACAQQQLANINEFRVY